MNPLRKMTIPLNRALSFALFTAILLLGNTQASFAANRQFTLISINDVYRLAGLNDGALGGLPRIRSLRRELEKDAPDLLLFHAGDALYPSLLSRQFRGAQMIDILNNLDGDDKAFDSRLFITFGNHEFDKAKLSDTTDLNKRVQESQFHWLSANIDFKDDDDGRPSIQAPNLSRHTLVESGDIKVGIFGLTTNIKHPAYIDRFADPAATARQETAALRKQGAEVVIALTHLAVADDAGLLQSLGDDGPDLIIGGHEHTSQIRKVGHRWVLKADSDAQSAIIAKVSVADDGSVRVDHCLRNIGPNPPPDPALLAKANAWTAAFDRNYCTQADLAPTCLDNVLGRTQTLLQGEELYIRGEESSLGNWLADQMMAAFPDRQAQGAFINAGSLRLNQDIPAGSTITRRDMEELFGFPAPLKLIAIDGATLQQVVSHAAQSAGAGGWLQIGGFAYRYDPDTGIATGLTLLAPDGPRPVTADETLHIAVVDYLIDPSIGDQDGYTMLNSGQVIAEGPDLKTFAIDALTKAEPKGIAPVVEGRICNSRINGACLAGE